MMKKNDFVKDINLKFKELSPEAEGRIVDLRSGINISFIVLIKIILRCNKELE